MARKRSPARLVVALSIAAVLAVFLLYTSIAGNATPALGPAALAGHTGKVTLTGHVVGYDVAVVTTKIWDAMSPAQQAHLANLGIPVVIVDPAGAPDPAVPSVGATNWAGGVAATEHLIGLGHKRIAVIGGPTDVLCSRARVDGYRAAMNAAGLKIPAGFVRTGDFLSPTGYRETLVLLSQPRPPTAIFVCADQMALGAYEALYERGLRVPDDVSVVGFDDLEEARWAIPPLTTVRQPLAEMAGMGTRMLLQLIDGEELDMLRVELSTSLVVRSSTAQPKPEVG